MTTLSFTEQTTTNGVCEQLFTLDGVPGVLWAPDADPAGRPLVLLVHGGGQHKRHPGLVARAHRFVTAFGAAAVALDAPGHGDRPAAVALEEATVERYRVGLGQAVIGPRGLGVPPRLEHERGLPVLADLE